MKRVLLCVVLLAGACTGSDDPTPTTVPTTPTSAVSSTVPPPTTSTTESPSGVLSEQLAAWSALGIADYDLEYSLDREGGEDSGTYRAVVRDGEAINCYRDGDLALTLRCDSEYYSVGSLFDRVLLGDARLADVTYDEEWHFPVSIDHDAADGRYTLEVVSFTPQDPVDWVAYVEDALDFVEANYQFPELEVDWAAVREEALSLVVANPRRINAFAGLGQVVLQVPGVLFLTAREWVNVQANIEALQNRQGGFPTGERIGDVGYLSLVGAFPNVADTYASTVHELMQGLDAELVCGWVVDLRDQEFLDIAREMLALGPLFGEGLVMTRTLGDRVEEWSYVGGSVFINGEPVVDLYEADGINTEGLMLDDPFAPTRPDLPIALLTSIRSGSWPLLGFSGREGTFVVGEPAGGGLGIFSIGEARVVSDLPLGAKLFVTRSGGVADRNGDLFEPRPDRIVLPIPDSGVDEVLEVALEWLAEQSSCAGVDTGNG